MANQNTLMTLDIAIREVNRAVAAPLSKREALMITHAGNSAAFEAVCVNVRALLQNPPESLKELADHTLKVCDRVDQEISAKVSTLVKIPEEATAEVQLEASERAQKRIAAAIEQGKSYREFDLGAFIKRREAQIEKATVEHAHESAIQRYRLYRTFAGLTAQMANQSIRDRNLKKGQAERTWLTALVAGSSDIANAVIGE